MRTRQAIATIFLAGVLVVAASAAQAVPIRTLPDLLSVHIFERTGGLSPANLPYGPNDLALTEKRSDRLSNGNSDHATASNEFYDFFYSDADGTFDIDGMFLTITAVFDNAADGGLNISGAALQFSTGIEYANTVSSFVALGAFSFPATVNNALGNTPGTTTFLGDTAGQPNDVRLSLTLGFASSAPPPVAPVPEPATGLLFLLGLLGLGAAARFNRV